MQRLRVCCLFAVATHSQVLGETTGQPQCHIAVHPVYIGTSTPATPYCARQACALGARPVVVRRVQAPFKSSVMQVLCSSCRALSSDGDEAGRCDKQAAGPLRAVRQGGRGSRRRHHRGTASAWRPPRSSPPPPTPAPPPPPPPARRTRRPRRSCTGWSSPRSGKAAAPSRAAGRAPRSRAAGKG